MTIQKLIQLDYINAILEKVQSHYAEVLKMHFIDRLTQEEIAKEKGVSRSAIGIQIQKGLRECRHVTNLVDKKRLEPIEFSLIVSTEYEKSFFLSEGLIATAQL